MSLIKNLISDSEQEGANIELDGLLNGLSLERQGLTVVVSGTNVYLDVEALDGGDMTYWLDDTQYNLDCTTASGTDGKARVELIQGTATDPQSNFVYVSYAEQSNKLGLTVTSFESLPGSSYAPVAMTTIQDYATVSSNGPLMLQRTTETVDHSGKGAVSWEREKLRALGAQYWSGIDPDFNITTNGGSEDNMDFSTTGGTVFQLHRQQLDNTTISGNGIKVANASGDGTLTGYQELTDLNEIHEIADGTALNSGDSINIVIWGSANYGEENKLFVNLPNSKYTTDADAVADVDRTAIKTIPSEFRTTGYLIAQLVLKYTSTDNGTWSNLLTKSILTWHTEFQTWNTPNYPSNYNNGYAGYLATLFHSGAVAMRVVFDDFNTEANYDYIRLRNAGGTNIFSYHGNLSPFTSANMGGDTIRVYFQSDGSVTRKGVRSFKYEYQLASAAGAEFIDLRSN